VKGGGAIVDCGGFLQKGFDGMGGENRELDRMVAMYG